MNKIWILSPIAGSCCGCAGKTGPCDSCFVCSGYLLNTGSQTILTGANIPVNKFARFGDREDCDVIFADNDSSITTLSNTEDYTIYTLTQITGVIGNYFNYQLSLNSGDKVTIYAEDLDPTPLIQVDILSGSIPAQGIQWSTIKQSYLGAGGLFNLSIAPQIGKGGSTVQYGMDIKYLDIESGSWQNPNGLYDIFTLPNLLPPDPSCSIITEAVQFYPNYFNGVKFDFYSSAVRNQNYSIVTSNTTSTSPLSSETGLLNQFNINSARQSLAQGAQFLPTTSCTNPPPTPVDPLSIMQPIPPDRGYLQTTFSIEKIWSSAGDFFDPPTGVKQVCVSITCQNQGYIQVTKSNGSPVNIKNRLVNLQSGLA